MFGELGQWNSSHSSYDKKRNWCYAGAQCPLVEVLFLIPLSQGKAAIG